MAENDNCRAPEFTNWRRLNSYDSQGSCEELTTLYNRIHEFGNKLRKYKEFCEYIISTKVPEAERENIRKWFNNLESTGGKIIFLQIFYADLR
jgi:hypothetical protein